MIYSTKDIQDKIFLINDKIKWMEMFLAHAKSDLHELQEVMFDLEEQELNKKLSKWS